MDRNCGYATRLRDLSFIAIGPEELKLGSFFYYIDRLGPKSNVHNKMKDLYNYIKER